MLWFAWERAAAGQLATGAGQGQRAAAAYLDHAANVVLLNEELSELSSVHRSLEEQLQGGTRFTFGSRSLAERTVDTQGQGQIMICQ